MFFLCYEKTHWGGYETIYLSDEQTLIETASESGGGAGMDWLYENYPELEYYNIDTALEYLAHDLQEFRVFDENDMKEIAKDGIKSDHLSGFSFSIRQSLLEESRDFCKEKELSEEDRQL